MKIYLLFFLSSLILFFGIKTNFEIVYGDSGFMWIQVMDLIHSGYSDFSFSYPGKEFDPKGEFLPISFPFLGVLDSRYYIVFPPYLPLVVSLARVLFDSNLAIYLVQILFFSGSLFFLYLLFSEFSKRRWLVVSFVYLYLFCTTVFVYNLVIHEYSFGLFFLYGGIYFYQKFLKSDQHSNLIYSSLFFGLSVYFRLEFLIIITFISGLSFLFRRETRKQILYYWVPGFLIILTSFFILNTLIHHHPLGLRYILNMDDPAMGKPIRHELIFDLLFSKKMGFFYQSPYLALVILFSIFVTIRKGLWNDGKSYTFLYLSISILSMSLILMTAPNDGGHLSARYLFGVYPFLFVLGLLLFEALLDSKKTLFYWVSIFIIVSSVFFSFKQWLYAVQFIRSSDKNVQTMVDYFKSVNKKYIVFTDTNIPKNLQSLMYEKTMFVVSEKRLFPDFLAKKTWKIDPDEILIIRLLTTALPVDDKGCLTGYRFCKVNSPLPLIEAYSFDPEK